MDIDNILREEMAETAMQQGHVIVSNLSHTTPVFETGLDSRAFALEQYG